jgi:putative N-acetyltransferase (TIGR04045 family)
MTIEQQALVRQAGDGLGEWCRVADDLVDRAVHHAIRRAVFVDEQRLFVASDQDDRDGDPLTVHVVGFVGERSAGSVRLYPLGDGLWKGDRLAVLAAHRAGHLGATLVRFAVATAGARGGDRMTATVQQPNEVFFRRLGWARCADPELYLGRPHVTMEIPLG